MNKVKELREARGLSQSALAKICDCSQPTIAAIEANGTTNVQLAQKIAAALNKPIAELFPIELKEKPAA